MLKIKSSMYNFLYPYKENNNSEVIIYNARTGSLATLDEEDFKMYSNFINDKIEIDNEDFRKNLILGGFFLPYDLDELEMIRFNMMQSRFKTDNFVLTLAPTMDCNFACIYCYEKNSIKKLHMVEEVQEKVVELLESNIKSVSNVHIAWYGGEPTLAFNIVKSLSKRFIDICNNNNVTYSSNLVTNGYNLSKDIANSLEECNINSIQVTLDGPRDIHNKRRPLLCGQGTFDKIISNLKHCIGKVGNIAIRINTDIDNEARINEVIHELEINGLLNPVNPYLGFVDAINEVYVKDKCMTVEMYSKKSLSFMKNNNLDLIKVYPRVIGNYCGADNINSFVIDPKGDVYKCWNDIGIKDNSVGNILEKDAIATNLTRYLNYMSYDPTMDKKCVKCNLLPICMGGCPHKRITGLDGCCDQKFTLQDYIIECANSIVYNRRKEAKEYV